MVGVPRPGVRGCLATALLVRILRKPSFVAKAYHLIDSRNKQAEKRFSNDYKREVENKTLLKQTVPGVNRQTYCLTLVVQTETIVFFYVPK